ncbi:UNVERIFIED_CONTAM: Peptidyl-prolyl cis-trans isomerase FKBP16-4, chloroplastic [Sesamum radiatum]|uniref:Peptidyl-prolyl cis-trans isomerase FKBP16-4, chloroplastic n=1 Tax=Sesamum radiatum TaxID=300843 RepID=A0AAW2KRM8_SESRA
MELSLLCHPLKPTFSHQSLSSLSTTGKINSCKNASFLGCRCSSSSLEGLVQKISSQNEGRRALMGCLLAAAAGISFSEAASAVSTSRRALRGAKIPESEYTTLPNGLKTPVKVVEG